MQVSARWVEYDVIVNDVITLYVIMCDQIKWNIKWMLRHHMRSHYFRRDHFLVVRAGSKVRKRKSQGKRREEAKDLGHASMFTGWATREVLVQSFSRRISTNCGKGGRDFIPGGNSRTILLRQRRRKTPRWQLGFGRGGQQGVWTGGFPGMGRKVCGPTVSGAFV